MLHVLISFSREISREILGLVNCRWLLVLRYGILFCWLDKQSPLNNHYIPDDWNVMIWIDQSHDTLLPSDWFPRCSTKVKGGAISIQSSSLFTAAGMVGVNNKTMTMVGWEGEGGGMSHSSGIAHHLMHPCLPQLVFATEWPICRKFSSWCAWLALWTELANVTCRSERMGGVSPQGSSSDRVGRVSILTQQ